ncbi:hypothetical protein D3C71_1614420 [compost metagenome]
MVLTDAWAIADCMPLAATNAAITATRHGLAQRPRAAGTAAPATGDASRLLLVLPLPRAHSLTACQTPRWRLKTIR